MITTVQYILQRQLNIRFELSIYNRSFMEYTAIDIQRSFKVVKYALKTIPHNSLCFILQTYIIVLTATTIHNHGWEAIDSSRAPSRAHSDILSLQPSESALHGWFQLPFNCQLFVRSYPSLALHLRIAVQANQSLRLHLWPVEIIGSVRFTERTIWHRNGLRLLHRSTIESHRIH